MRLDNGGKIEKKGAGFRNRLGETSQKQRWRGGGFFGVLTTGVTARIGSLLLKMD